MEVQEHVSWRREKLRPRAEKSVTAKEGSMVSDRWTPLKKLSMMACFDFMNHLSSSSLHSNLISGNILCHGKYVGRLNKNDKPRLSSNHVLQSLEVPDILHWWPHECWCCRSVAQWSQKYPGRMEISWRSECLHCEHKGQGLVQGHGDYFVKGHRPVGPGAAWGVTQHKWQLWMTNIWWVNGMTLPFLLPIMPNTPSSWLQTKVAHSWACMASTSRACSSLFFFISRPGWTWLDQTRT